MAIAVESVKGSNLSGVKAGYELIEITLSDAAAVATKQDTPVPLGRTYRSIKPVAAIGQEAQFTIGVNIPDLSSVSIVSTAVAANPGNAKVFVTLECEV